MNLSVEVRPKPVSRYFINLECQKGRKKEIVLWSYLSCTHHNEHHTPSLSKNGYSTQVLKYSMYSGDFLVACLSNRCQRSSSVRCLQNKDRDLTTPRSSKLPFPDNVDVICVEIEVNQRCVLPQQTLCPV